MTAVPRLADVQLTRIVFEPGDRLIVRSRVPLSKEDAIRLHRTVQRWAGDHVEILVVDLNKMEVDIERSTERGKIIT